MKKQICSETFGMTSAGEKVTRYIMLNQAGMKVSVLDYGCTIQSIIVPDSGGNEIDVALGYDDLRGYETGNCYFGAFVGRYANRIKNAEFELDGKKYILEKNNGNNHLHGVYTQKVFDVSVEDESLLFRYVSPDGEEGYPGNLNIEVRYTLNADNSLILDYKAESDADTVVNFTNHTYFNLNGDGDILNHKLILDSDYFTEMGEGVLPTGKILPVAGTPLDFRNGKKLGDDIFAQDEQMLLCRGYDHNFVLDTSDNTIRKFAEAIGDKSGIKLKAYTTQPGVQLYTGNFVDEDTATHGKNDIRYPRHAGFCLETQHYPCSPNYPQFPSTVLRKGEEYHETTIFRIE